MAQTAKISFIIPVYNVEKYLRQCLDSVVNQTLRDIEIICVDDGSTDSSGQILATYARKDKRIKVYTQENSKVSVARNKGLELATAPYLMFVDSDDYIAPNMAEIMYQKITEFDVDTVVCDVQCFADDEDGVKYADLAARRQNWFDKYIQSEGLHNIPVDIRKELNPVVWNKIYKTDIVREFQIQFPVGINQEDEYWLWAYMIHCERYYYISQKLYFYCIREGSIMDTKDNLPNVLNILDIYKQVYSVVRQYKNIILYKEILTNLYMNTVRLILPKVSNCLYETMLAKIRDYTLQCNASYTMFDFYKKMQTKLTEKQDSTTEKPTA